MIIFNYYYDYYIKCLYSDNDEDVYEVVDEKIMLKTIKLKKLKIF